MKTTRLFLLAFLLFGAGFIAFNRLPYFQGTVDDLEVPLWQLDPGQVHNISIATPTGEEYLFSRVGQQWMLSSSQWTNEVSLSLMNAMVERLQEVYSLGIVAQNADGWPPINLTERRARLIKVYDQERVLQSFYLSRAPRPDSLGTEGTYLRFPESEIAYEVTPQIGDTYLQDFQRFRTRDILDFDPAQVRVIRRAGVTRDTLLLQRRDTLWYGPGASGGIEIASWLDSMAQLQGSVFADRFSELEAPGARVWQMAFFLENQTRLQLNVYRDSNQVALPYVIQSDQYPERYFQGDSAWIAYITQVPFNSWEK